ncbi:flagellar hook-length control protein FliK [Vibrio sp. SM6]|uniref:Flagellar hook-length control protein FliK n=2 Tax=Vibrio agarilyticus TaxID=2726741 RepID=A0A7X8YHG8_9VIBR|nr:flagellar hook-length control protein FliK [Vibrio agarilyticus]
MSALPSLQNANAIDALVKSPSDLARAASTLDALTTQFGANPALRGADSITQKDLIARGLNPTMSQMVKPGDATLMPLTPMHRDSAPRQQGGENTLSHLTNLTQAIALTSPQSSDAAMPQSLIRGWADGVNSPQSTIDSALTRPVEWAPVKVDSNAGRWGEQMLQALHDKVSLQAQQNLQEARIRLDPPDLGKLDLIVRVEGDRLNVQLNANVAATREALAQVSERLRSELQSEHFVHVDVNVGGERDSSQQSPSQQTAQHIHTARELDDDAIYTDITSEHWLNIQA